MFRYVPRKDVRNRGHWPFGAAEIIAGFARRCCNWAWRRPSVFRRIAGHTMKFANLQTYGPRSRVLSRDLRQILSLNLFPHHDSTYRRRQLRPASSAAGHRGSIHEPPGIPRAQWHGFRPDGLDRPAGDGRTARCPTPGAGKSVFAPGPEEVPLPGKGQARHSGVRAGGADPD